MQIKAKVVASRYNQRDKVAGTLQLAGNEFSVDDMRHWLNDNEPGTTAKTNRRVEIFQKHKHDRSVDLKLESAQGN